MHYKDFYLWFNVYVPTRLVLGINVNKILYHFHIYVYCVVIMCNRLSHGSTTSIYNNVWAGVSNYEKIIFGVYFSSFEFSLKWAHWLFATTAHNLFHFLPDMMDPWITTKIRFLTHIWHTFVVNKYSNTVSVRRQDPEPFFKINTFFWGTGIPSMKLRLP